MILECCGIGACQTSHRERESSKSSAYLKSERAGLLVLKVFYAGARNRRVRLTPWKWLSTLIRRSAGLRLSSHFLTTTRSPSLGQITLMALYSPGSGRVFPNASSAHPLTISNDVILRLPFCGFRRPAVPLANKRCSSAICKRSNERVPSQ